MSDRNEEWLGGQQSGGEIANRSVSGIALQFLRAFAVLLTAVVLARVLEPRDFGIVATILPLVALAELLNNFGITVAIVQSAKLGQSEVTTYFWVQLLFGLFLGGLLAIAGPLWAHLYDDGRMVSLAAVMGGIIFIGVLGNVHNALLRRNLMFGKITFVQVLAAVIGLIGAIIAGQAGLGYWALVIRQFLATSVALVAFWLICSWKPGRFAIHRDAFGGLRFGGVMAGGQLFDYLRRNVDIMLIRRFSDVDMLGNYNRAQRIMMMPVTQIMGPVMAVALPMLSRKQDSPDYREYFENVFRFCLAMAVPVGVFGFFFPDAVVRVVLGEKWMEAVPIFRGLAVAAIFLPMGNCLSINLIVYRRVKTMLVLPAIAACLCIVAYYLGIQHSVARLAEYYGLVAAGMLPIFAIIVIKSTPISGWSLVRLAIPIVGCMAAAIVGASLTGDFVRERASDLEEYVAEMISFAVLYALLLLFAAGYWKKLMMLVAMMRSRSSGRRTTC